VSIQDLVAISKTLRYIIDEADSVARTNSKILITGESGVGKEVLARYIHARSLRSQKRMVTINCAGVPETLLESELFGHVRGSFTGAHRDSRGLLEAAHGGTALLDEIGEMSLRMQTLLLRFLETGEIQRVGAEWAERILDVRLIAATNRNLLDETRRKAFREDLYYRINVVHLTVPPLRERIDDIAPLFDHYLRVASENARLPRCSVTPEALAKLQAYSWPGNIRELRNISERIALRCSGRDITVADLPCEVVPAQTGAAGAPLPPQAGTSLAAVYYERMTRGGESFWTVVYEPFMLRDITRETVRLLIRRGLVETRGNYGLVTKLFNLSPGDYKRFLTFLQKHDCHVPFKLFRVGPAVVRSQEKVGQADHLVAARAIESHQFRRNQGKSAAEFRDFEEIGAPAARNAADT
jgi:transcriptional regulator with PAS, ATPase and Fis domain